MSPGPETPAPRRVIVARHAETVDNAARIWQGHADSVLSEAGRRQVAAAAPHLAAYRPVTIVSSDLQRAVSTAEGVARLLGLPVRLDVRLREVHVGQWQGRGADEVRAAHPELVAALDRGEDVARGVTGETRREVAARAGAALREVVDGLGAGEAALVVAHGVSSRVGVSDLVGLDQAEGDRVLRGLDNCHWIELVEATKSYSTVAQWRIAGWNLGPA